MYYGDFINEVIDLMQHTDTLYIYGAGLRGKEIYHILSRNGIHVDGFIVTKLNSDALILGQPIFQADKVIFGNTGIVVGLGDIYTKEVMAYLNQQNIPLSRIVDGGKYISQDRGSKDLQDNPTIEITTVLGCSVQCRYCPQSLLVKRYYEGNPNRPRLMTLETFKKIVENTPLDCDFMFAGMSEPFLNPHCVEMLRIACDTGRNVSLYTTLEGASQQDIQEIQTMPFQFFGLHVPDVQGNAKIQVNNQYIKNISQLIDAKKVNGENFINDISAQAEPIPEIAMLCKGKYEVLVSLQDRAGNLQDEGLARREHILTNEKITCCFSGPKFNNHVALPDGTLLLCNMDYGMQHVLGNIVEDTYEEIREMEEMKRVMRGVSGNSEENILCKKCLFAMIKS